MTASRVNTRLRTKGALIVVLVMLTVMLGKLVTIQTVEASALSAAGTSARERSYVLYSARGAITDRNGTPLAFSIEGKSIAARPANFENDAQREKVADILVAVLGPPAVAGSTLTKADLMTKLKSTKGYVYLVRGVMPAQSELVMARIRPILTDKKAKQAAQNVLINAVVTERQPIRTNPDGTLASAVVGSTGWDSKGQSGIESKFNDLLKGKDGSKTLQVDNKGNLIPNAPTTVVPAVDGSSLQLTLDADWQFSAQQMLEAQVATSKAKGGCVVVKGISDGQIYAMACTEAGKTAAQIGNPAVSIPFEPGSVNKVVTFAAALESGLITPTTVMTVDGGISIGGHTIHDAWAHGRIDMTATGILAKSSNVGTLMIAQKVGQDAFAKELTKFGLGQKTGIELPGESPGLVPPLSQWSATSFANLPIGQGVSMTLVQLVDMYQAIGNKGVMVSPTILAGTTTAGTFAPAKVRAATQVMSPATAATLLGMLRATVQSGDLNHRGTAAAAAITGYQVAGKTGTAQQVDAKTKAYSESLYNATFAGVVPADNPRFAIAVMLDAPQVGSEGGTSAAPLFHEVAAYAMRAADVPPSATAAPIYDLYVNSAG